MIFGEGPIIKNIAGDLNKLFLQGTRAGQPITNVEGDAAADQGTVDLLAAMDPVIQEVAVGMSGEESRHYTVSGVPPLALTDSVGKPLASWSVDLLPYQEGTGDPSPTNIRPIHGTTKLKLYVEESFDQSATPKAVIDVPPLSANQWDEEWEVGGLYNNSGLPWETNDRIRSKNYIAILPNTTYYVTISLNACCFYDAEYNYIEGSGKGIGTFRTPESAAYMKFATYSAYGTTYRNDIAINLPSSVTTYNPFNSTVYYGTIGDYGGESKWGEYTIYYVGSVGTSTLGVRYAQCGVISSAKYDGGIMCESYKPSTNASTDNSIRFIGTSLYVYDNRITDIETAQSLLIGLKLIYELDTPVQFAITAPSIPTPRGDATTWATAEDGTVDSMKVTYIGKS